MPSKRKGSSKTVGPMVLARAEARPVTNILTTKPATSGGMRYTMTETLGTVTGDKVHTHKISPAWFQGSWTRTICLAFERYKFHNIRVQFVPVVGTDVNGMVSTGFDIDPEDENVKSVAGIMANASSVSNPVWSGFEIRLKNEAREWFYVHNEYVDRWSREGLFGLLYYKLTHHAPNTADNIYMQVFVHYDVEFRNPTFSIATLAKSVAAQLEGSAIGLGDVAPKPWFNGARLGNLPVRNLAYGDVIFDTPGDYSVEYEFRGGSGGMKPEADPNRTTCQYKLQGEPRLAVGDTVGWARFLVRVAEVGLKLAIARTNASGWSHSRLNISPHPYA